MRPSTHTDAVARNPETGVATMVIASSAWLATQAVHERRHAVADELANRLGRLM